MRFFGLLGPSINMIFVISDRKHDHSDKIQTTDPNVYRPRNSIGPQSNVTLLGKAFIHDSPVRLFRDLI